MASHFVYVPCYNVCLSPQWLGGLLHLLFLSDFLKLVCYAMHMYFHVVNHATHAQVYIHVMYMVNGSVYVNPRYHAGMYMYMFLNER